MWYSLHRHTRQLLSKRGLITLLAIGTLNTAAADTTNIAVAANFTAAAKALAEQFQQRSEHRVKFSFGSTGKLYTQIINGAPFDAFLSADELRTGQLTAQGQAVAASEFTYAVGQLALYSIDPNLNLQAGAILSTPDKMSRLAIANPKTAPYGAAAQAALEKLELWSALTSKLVQGDNIAQTYQFVSTGNATVGFVALAQIYKDANANYWPVPEMLHPPLRQNAVLLARGSSNPATLAFLEFLKSTPARELIASYGYGLSEEN
ncbi:molybdate ABC transporter substrate-binding protein [Halioxenophilus sp. WMMB6]|uniref:molybdate ABC transporter substrate-binding protein n=1 Tax=Halioxenophilus sp. WMMB6 TaxID=3073815 RepID=UPI00295E8C63|nr:molybdate ABC transporter substrate-binding protein [Halioxenophilus sp. WMMB6]